ncbi:MAG: hypothetical protein ACREMQ_21200, partial [Longimicrobiales bacterium]
MARFESPSGELRVLRPSFPGDLIAQAVRDPLRLLMRMAAEGGDVVLARIAHRRVYLLNHPALVWWLLSNPDPTLVKERAMRLARAIFGNGLLTSEEPVHLSQRRLVLPALQPRRVS